MNRLFGKRAFKRAMRRRLAGFMAAVLMFTTVGSSMTVFADSDISDILVSAESPESSSDSVETADAAETEAEAEAETEAET
ncbi:MAG: hypothetical protein Q4E57_10450, partial [Eubacteriales bacterium]|nr:hypothetical protein [Eubacteriales bacterium]